MYRLRHPFSGMIYGALGGDLVLVEARDGTRATYSRYGELVEGPAMHVDREMLRWLGTQDLAAPTRHRAGFDRPAEGDHIEPLSDKEFG